jgi:hypothetical protein
MSITFLKKTIATALLLPVISLAAQNYSLHSSGRDGMGNLVCTYANGETINMGQSWSNCPSSITR